MDPLIFITGAPGTGKSTTAAQLEASLDGYVIHSLYQVRRDLGHRRYIPQRKEEVFAELIQRAAISLEREEPVIIDSAVSRSAGRQRVYDLAVKYSVDVLVLECLCSAEEAKRRIRKRPKNDGLYCEARKPIVYTRFMEKMKQEPINRDLAKQGSAHLSYIQFDTENDSLSVERALGSGEELVHKVTRALVPEMKKLERVERGYSYCSASI